MFFFAQKCMFASDEIAREKYFARRTPFCAKKIVVQGESFGPSPPSSVTSWLNEEADCAWSSLECNFARALPCRRGLVLLGSRVVRFFSFPFASRQKSCEYIVAHLKWEPRPSFVIRSFPPGYRKEHWLTLWRRENFVVCSILPGEYLR
jgi:hypothetical protein